jgi:hypothetical protein
MEGQEISVAEHYKEEWKSARAAAAIFASLVLAAGTFGAQSSGADEMMGRHSMEGKITSVDAKKGWVHVKTQVAR